MNCFFVSDIHGKIDRYESLFKTVEIAKPKILFLGGDLLPHSYQGSNFVLNFLLPKLSKLKNHMGSFYPSIFLILGNDDARSEEKNIIEGANLKLFEYIHFEKREIGKYNFYGYSFTPPSPFLLKDWEKFDVSRYVDPGCISPNEGKTTTPSSEKDAWHRTMAEDINALVNSDDVQNGIFLFHAPPYKSNLDRAALDGKIIDHIPLDVHVGSIAVRKFIENKQPLLTLHGHIHESARITGQWKDKIGKTFCFSAAHDGKELAIVKFDLTNLEKAERILI